MATQSALRPAEDDPRPTWRWRIEYEDTFDRDMPATVEIQGNGLVPALAELWVRFLRETVQTATEHREGELAEVPTRGFSEYQLIGEGLRLRISGSLAGGLRLKHWLFPAPNRFLGVVEGVEARLLRGLAEAHARAAGVEEAALAILDAAESAADRDAFVVRLGELRASWT